MRYTCKHHDLGIYDLHGKIMKSKVGCQILSRTIIISEIEENLYICVCVCTEIEEREREREGK